MCKTSSTCPRCKGYKRIKVPYEGPMEEHFGQGGWGFPQYQYVLCPDCCEKKDNKEYSHE